MAYLAHLKASPSHRKSQLAILAAGVLTLVIAGAWFMTLGTRLGSTGSLSASNETTETPFSASDSIEARLNDLGSSFSAFGESLELLTGSSAEDTSSEVGGETDVYAETQ